MKNRRIISAITAGLICLSFAACSNSGNAPAAETSKKTEQTTTTAADKNESETSADETSAAEENVSLSGKVTVYMPSPTGLADKIAAGFQEKTGVQVEHFRKQPERYSPDLKRRLQTP